MNDINQSMEVSSPHLLDRNVEDDFRMTSTNPLITKRASEVKPRPPLLNDLSPISPYRNIEKNKLMRQVKKRVAREYEERYMT